MLYIWLDPKIGLALNEDLMQDHFKQFQFRNGVQIGLRGLNCGTHAPLAKRYLQTTHGASVESVIPRVWDEKTRAVI